MMANEKFNLMLETQDGRRPLVRPEESMRWVWVDASWSRYWTPWAYEQETPADDETVF